MQQRFHQDSGYDTKIQSFCTEKNIEYQSFWTLGSNQHLITNDWFRNNAAEKGMSAECLMYVFALTIGITPLDGTKDDGHMREDFEVVRRMKSGEIIISSVEVTHISELLGFPKN